MTVQRGPLPEADAELWTLTESAVNGMAAPAEMARLEERLHAEPSARSFYVAYLDLHAYLQWQSRGAASPILTSERARPAKRRASRWPAIAAAAMLAAGVLVAILFYRPATNELPSTELAGLDLPSTPAGSVAVLIDKGGAVWEDGTGLPTQSGSALLPGRLRLKSGTAEVAFHDGGEVLLEGPADFDVTAGDRGYLRLGKLTARVASGASTFHLNLPGMVANIQGECGLIRDETGRTEVHVFEGSVGASPADEVGQSLPEVRLTANDGARLDVAHRTMSPVPLDSGSFERLRQEVWAGDVCTRAGQYADQNFGTATRLMVKNSILDYTWESYLRFDLSGVHKRASEARVRLMPVRVGFPIENSVAQVVDDPWGETSLTWNTRPISGPAFASWTVRQGEPVEFDVTALVNEALAGDKRLTLRIFAPNLKRGSGYVQYGSRKGEDEFRPRLMITTVP